MRGVNKVIVLGRATRDTERRETKSGKPVSNIRMATNRVVKTPGQELHEDPQYHTVVCFDRLAETTQKWVTKGRLIYVEGRLETRTFTDKAGRDREATEIIAQDVQFLDRGARGATDTPDQAEEEVSSDDIPL
jgi:single-strand DNA-binding protein